MTISNNSSDIVSIVVALSFLTPLVKAFHRWHIDLRKTAKPGKRQPMISVEQGGGNQVLESRMSNWDRFFIIFFALNIILDLLLILMFSLVLPPRAATSRDVGQIGLSVVGIVMALYCLDQIVKDQRSVN
jgi:hypothetical protein